ncbi:MAG: hypothetical protein RLZZ528_739 [Pseudomonadota bacterium]
MLAAIGFGWIVLDEERGRSRLGALGETALSLAEIPNTIEHVLTDDGKMQAFNPDRFADQPDGWTVAPEFAGKLPGYVLLSRYDGDAARHVVELVRLSDQTVVHDWRPDAEALLADVQRTSKVADFTLWNNRAWRAIHPALSGDGTLIVKDHQSALMALDACGGRVWKQDAMMFHHSTEPDGAGGWWVPGLIEPQTIEKVAGNFYEDALVHLSADGEVVQTISLTQVLIDHGYEHRLFGAGVYTKDPSHLNDIQPVLADGPFWKKGDLFLSLRHLSMVLLYRPSENRIVWAKDGPWMAQHDVDIIGPTQISVFDNQGYDRGLGARVKDHNRVAVYDFATDRVSFPYDAAMADAKTLFEGLADAMPGGLMMVEEENSGRVLIASADGRVAASYLNKGEDGLAYRLGWSRYVSQADGDRFAAQIAATSCPAK